MNRNPDPSPALLPRSVRMASVLYLCHLATIWWISGGQGFLILALIAGGDAVRRGELRVPPRDIYFALALYVAASVASAAGSTNPLDSARELSEWFMFLSVPLGVSLFEANRRLGSLAAGVLLWVTIFLASWGLFQFLVLGRRELERRITGPTPHVMTYSGIVLLLSLLALVRVLERRTVVDGIAAAMATLALLLTFTRSAWIGWLAGLIALLGLGRRWKTVGWALTLIVLGSALSPMGWFGRLVSSFDVRQSSNLDRIRMAQAGTEIIRDHPVLGVGPGQVPDIYPLYRQADAPRYSIPHLHSNPIQIWSERGVGALAAYCMFFVLVAREGLRRRSEWKGRAALSASVALFVAGLFEFNFGDSEVLMMLMSLTALTVSGPPNGDPGLENGDRGPSLSWF